MASPRGTAAPRSPGHTRKWRRPYRGRRARAPLHGIARTRLAVGRAPVSVPSERLRSDQPRLRAASFSTRTKTASARRNRCRRRHMGCAGRAVGSRPAGLSARRRRAPHLGRAARVVIDAVGTGLWPHDMPMAPAPSRPTCSPKRLRCSSRRSARAGAMPRNHASTDLTSCSACRRPPCRPSERCARTGRGRCPDRRPRSPSFRSPTVAEGRNPLREPGDLVELGAPHACETPRHEASSSLMLTIAHRRPFEVNERYRQGPA
jgi:hypothetical protein